MSNTDRKRLRSRRRRTRRLRFEALEERRLLAVTNLIDNPSFEFGVPDAGSRPTDFAHWQGDEVDYVAQENDISPPDGSKMLQFEKTSTGLGGELSQYFQNIDLSDYRTAIAAGNTLLSASAVFNRVPGDAQTDTKFTLVVYARSGDPSSYTNLATWRTDLLSDGDVQSWERAAIGEVFLPANTDFLQVEIAAVENVHEDNVAPEFDGHYADHLRLMIRNAADSDVAPTLWFEDNNLGQPGGTTPDWEQTFTQPEQWAYALQALDTYGINNDWHLINSNDPVPDSFLRDHLVPTLERNHVSLALDTGPATWMSHNLQQSGLTVEQFLQPYGDLIEKLRSYGARVDQVTLSFPLCAPLLSNGQEIEYSMEQRIQDVVNYSRYMTARFPDLRIGIIDYLPTHGLPYRTPYAQLRDAMAAEGILLDHIHLVVPAGVAFNQTWGMSWDKAVEVQAYVQQELGLKFGVTLTSDEGGYQSGEFFHNQTIEALGAYQQAVADSADPGEHPERFVAISWYPYPDRSLPEFSDTYTTTHVVRSLGWQLYDVEEVRQILPTRVEASSTAPGYDPWDAVNGHGLIDRQHTDDHTKQWKSGRATQVDEWFKVQFCQQYTLDAMRFWNFNGATAAEDSNGIGLFDIYASQSGYGNPVDDPQDWQLLIQGWQPDRAVSLGDDPGQFIDLPDATAAAVALVARQNLGGSDFGIAEMRFFTAADLATPGESYPWLNSIEDVVIPENAVGYQVALDGIKLGCDDDRPLTVHATSDNPDLLPDPQAIYTDPDTTGTLLLTPRNNSYGLAKVTVTVEDGGLDQNLQTPWDNGVYSRTFAVSIERQPADLGDAPEPYPTLLGDNGARHSATGPILGTHRDTELDGQPAVGADGDDGQGTPSDEDGIDFTSTLRVGQLDASVAVAISNAPDGAYLDAWIDFNGDGSWGGVWEQVADSVPVVEGVNDLWFDIPAWASAGETYARFRLSSSGWLAPGGNAPDGEVEDVRLAILPSGSETGAFHPHVVATDADAARAVFSADMDGDGDVDLLSASESDNTISWYENDGQQQFSRHTVSPNVNMAMSVFATDLDADGDMDVVSTSFGNNKVLWHENDGQQNFTQHVIASDALGAHDAIAADLDQDGDVDVLSASALNNSITWHEQYQVCNLTYPPRNCQSSFITHVIDDAAIRARSVQVADLDRDGDLDVIAASQNDNTVAWHENDGNQAFTKHVVDTEAVGTQYAVPSDVDLDGDLDLVAAWTEGDAIAWYENDGDSHFERHWVTQTSAGPHNIDVVDVDGDGDVDVIAANKYANAIVWYENDGQQQFVERVVADDTEMALGVHAADVDQDGDLDVVSASWSDDKIAWHENVIDANRLPNWSKYIGDAGTDEGKDVVVDDVGNIYITGATNSSGWTSGGFDTTYAGGKDAFVVKLNPSGQLLWSTYLGGNSTDAGKSIAVDEAGNVYVVGGSWSSGWTSRGFDTDYGGDEDAFVVKLNNAGQHLWSTYLGAAGTEHGQQLALDGEGNVYVAGTTRSSDWTSGGADTTFNGGWSDAFIAKLSSSGQHVWSTYLGGANTDAGHSIAVDGAGSLYVTGLTWSPGWANGGFDLDYDGNRDAYVAKFTDTGQHVWSTYLGGSERDTADEIDVDQQGAVYVTGTTNSSGWISGGFDTELDGIEDDAFVVKLNSIGSHLWSTYLGGNETDSGKSIAVDATNGIWVTGSTNSAGWLDGGWASPIEFSAFENPRRVGVDDFALGHDSLVIGFDRLSDGSGVAPGTVIDTAYRDVGVEFKAILTKGPSAGEATTTQALDFTLAPNFGADVALSAPNILSAVDPAAGANASGQVAGTATLLVSFLAPDGSPGTTSHVGAFNDGIFNNNIMTAYSGPDGTGLVLGTVSATSERDFFGLSSHIGIGSITFSGISTEIDDLVFGPTALSGDHDAYAVNLSSSGQHTFSTYLGGSRDDRGDGITVDSGGRVYVTGWTDSPDFPNRINEHFGGKDAFVAKLPQPFDFGDAPSPYATLLSEDGARHTATGPTLGTHRDMEADGQPTATANGDDAAGRLSDEDGVDFGGDIRVGQLDGLVTVHVGNAPSGAKLDAWIDFNGDGSWGGPFERIADSVSVADGDNTITFDVPSWAIVGNTFARFRLSTVGGLGVKGEAADGEVEDYAVAVIPPVRSDGLFSQQKLISTVADGAENVFAVDLDGDGDMDAVSASDADNTIAWHENDGSQSFQRHVISSQAFAAHGLFAQDMDGDGDMDVLATAHGDGQVNVAWYENDGSEHFVSHAIAIGDGANSVFPADLDGDGDFDLVTAYQNADVVWYENLGHGDFGPAHWVTNLPDLWDVTAVDMDRDGDLDLLAASNGRIFWYENDGSQQFTSRLVSRRADGHRGLFAVDVDRDGDMDVVYAARWDDEIGWCENDGSQNFTEHVISADVAQPFSVFAADVDGDSDVDILSTSKSGDKIMWFENDGEQNFASHVISPETKDPRRVIASDVDGDGDLDVLSASHDDDKIAWYENVSTSPPATDAVEITLSVSATPFGQDRGEIWGGSTLWVNVYVRDLRDVPQGVVGGALDLLFETSPLTPTGDVVYGSDFPLHRQGTPHNETGVIDEIGALASSVDVGVDTLAPFASWEFQRDGVGAPDDPNSEVRFESEPGEGTGTIHPSHFALVGEVDPIPWEQVVNGTLDLSLLLGDFTHDRLINQFDLAMFVPQLFTSGDDGSYDPEFDLTDDEWVNQFDLALLIPRLFQPALQPDAEGETDSSSAATFFGQQSSAESEGEHKLRVRLETSRTIGGEPLSGPVDPTTEPTFFVNVYVQDLRTKTGGVVGGVVDVTWTDDSVSVDPTIIHGSDFALLHQGQLNNASREVDEVGALTATGGVGANSEALFFAVEVTATSSGQVTFSAKPAEGTGFIDPAHFAAVGSPQPIDWNDVEFVDTTVTINSPPHVANLIPDQQAEENHPFGFVFSQNAFSDADDEDILTFTSGRADGSQLPTWLVFDGSVRSFSGTPKLGDAGQVHVRVAATDTSGLSADTTFTITVTPDPNPWQNPGAAVVDKMDVDGNGLVSPLDVLTVINYVNQNGAGDLPEPATPSQVERLYVDVNGDDDCTPLDVLELINFINSRPIGEGEGTTTIAFPSVSERYEGISFGTSEKLAQIVSSYSTAIAQPTTSVNDSRQVQQAMMRGRRLRGPIFERLFALSGRGAYLATETDRPISSASRSASPVVTADESLLSDWDDSLTVIARHIVENPAQD